MRRVITFSVAAALVASPSQADVQGVASKVIPLANETNKCINTKTHAVSFWITSITLEKKNSWLTETDAVGTQIDLTLSSNSGSSSTFPRAREVSTNGVGGEVVRAYLGFPLLAQYKFEDSSNVNAIDVPVVFLRRKGDSSVAKYAKAMIDVTKQISNAIPTNPFAQWVDAGGKVAAKFFENASKEKPKDVVPAFAIAHTLSKSAACNENDLLDGMRALISDTSKKDIPGTIKVEELDSYCFYRTGAKSDPDIGYVKKTSSACPTATPTTTTTLRNPQIIYLVHAVPPEKIQGTRAALIDAGQASTGVNKSVSMTLPALSDPLKDEEVRRALEICDSAGINAAACFGLSQ